MKTLNIIKYLVLFFAFGSECKQLEIKNEQEQITFVANKETIGDGLNPSTMDYFQGTQYPHLSLVIPYLNEKGKKTEVIDWQDRTVEWSKKTRIILGPVWGYTRDIENFDSWLSMIEHENLEMVNDPKFLRWNLKKNYLLDLLNHGINIPKTLIIEPNSLSSFDDAFELFVNKFGNSDIILKGVIDAGGFGYLHVHPDKLDEARNHFNSLKLKNHGSIIQSFIPQVYKKGELSFVFFNGKISHFFLKVPKYNEERVQAFYGGKSFHFQDSKITATIESIKNSFRNDLDVSEKEIEHAYAQAKIIYSKLLKILDSLEIPHPRYLRMDGVVVDSDFVVMELEGIEPYLEIKESMKESPENNILEKYYKNVIEKN